jgi:hypothetical protein
MAAGEADGAAIPRRSVSAGRNAIELDSPDAARLGLDGFDEVEDWAFAEQTARTATPNGKNTRRISDIQRGKVMSEPR